MVRFALSCLFLFCLAGTVTSQTFTFECVCDHLTGDTCDICPTNSNVVSRSFHGLLIRRNGTPYRWIDEPYIIKRFANTSIQFIEQIPNPDQVTIALFQTPFSTMEGYVDSTTCFCTLGGAMDTVVVDTPIIGNGTPGHPLTIGQFGADTTKFLNWNGHHWYPGSIDFTDIVLNLPYFKGDTSAISAGLMAGDPYLLECDNDYGLPAGLFKVVKICGYDCTFTLKYFPNDVVAFANGVPIGKEYLLDEFNLYGLLYGFDKTVASDTLTNDTLLCNVALPYYLNDVDALVGGAAFGDLYNMSQANTYGAPWGMNRAVSTTFSTSADPPICCDPDATLPYYNNDSAAIAGGLSSGYYYYLTVTNTLGFPYGSKKRIP